MADLNVTRQARDIFRVAKMLRQHIFRTLPRVEGEGRECGHGDLSLAQLNLILTVRSRGRVSVGELAEILAVSPPSVSVMVDRLVERGLLLRERAADDRRRVVIRIGPDAEKNIKEREEQMIGAFVDLLEELGPETAGKWHEVLRRVEQVLAGRQTEKNRHFVRGENPVRN
ncbi:MAG: hypothetical protein Kow0089_06510 [Desulfobulbaceae bacterium]